MATTRTPKRPQISLVNVGITSSAMQALTEGSRDASEVERELVALLDRHVTGDWGIVDLHDFKANNNALISGARIVSAYQLYGVKLWIISDAAWGDNPRVREVTTILLPSDY